MTHSNTPLPTLVASENGRDGMLVAMELLRQGKSALDAVEIACRITEDDPDEHSVGYSGLPNILGEVELDASIMDGRTLRAGCVAAVQDYGHVITLARQVMEETAHVLLVGKGAQRLAAELGHSQADQRTEEATRRWRTRFEEMGLQLSDRTDLRRLAIQLTRPLNLDNAYERSRSRGEALEGENALKETGKEDRFGTVNYLALDLRGDLASAVSTSGLAWKYPGRVGDSPIIGAGNYCDNRYGAAACTGMGELALRASTARSLVVYLKMGMSLQEAGLETLRDLSALGALPGQYMNIVSLSPKGEHAGFTTVPGKKYLYMRADMDEPVLMERTLLS